MAGAMPNVELLCPGCFKHQGPVDICAHCGFDTAVERSSFYLPFHTVLDDQFVVGRPLGEPGGFGITYLAWDLVLETQVAIKEYLPRELASRSAGSLEVEPYSGADAELFAYGSRKFVEEARTLARLNHPNIVRVRHVFVAYGTTYLVMDYYRGQTLEQFLLEYAQPLESRAAVDIFMPILDGLRYVHEKGFLHRDIKPSNIYLADLESGNKLAILLDFGSARVALSERSRSMDVVLTQGYAPLEQYHEGGRQGPWTDVYGSAATLYRMISGGKPPDASSRVQEDTLAPPPGVSPELAAAILEGLAIRAEDRPRTIEAFQERILSSLSWTKPIVAEEELASRPPRPRPPAVAAWPLVLALIMLGGLAWGAFVWLGRNQEPVVVDDLIETRSVQKIHLQPLANDHDPEGDRLRVVDVGQPMHGTATLELDHSITYTPDPEFIGEDRFTYTIDDGSSAVRGQVTVRTRATKILAWSAIKEPGRWLEVLRAKAPARAELQHTRTRDPEALRRALADRDVFLLPPIPNSVEAAEVDRVAATFGPVLEAFTRAGGTVMAIGDDGFLLRSGLLAATPDSHRSTGPIYLAMPDHPLVRALPATSVRATSLTRDYEVSGPEVRVVARSDSGLGVILVRPWGEGVVILNGFDYTSSNPAMEHILATALFAPVVDASTQNEESRS